MKVEHRKIELELTRGKSETIPATLSTEFPVDRFWGKEILDHGPGSVDLSRASEGLPLLFSHTPEIIVGRVENVRVDGRRLRGDLRAGTSSKAAEIFRDIQEGIIKDLSIGYALGDDPPTEEGDGTYRFYGWCPLECSAVAIPGDPRAGIGRSINFQIKGERTMKDQNQEITERTLEVERRRVADIMELGERSGFQDVAQNYIKNGRTVEEFQFGVDELKKRFNAIPAPLFPDIGMSGREVQQFSVCRGIMGLITGNRSGLEFEASDAVAKQMRKAPQGFFVPNDVMRRDLLKGTGSAGGFTVATDVLASSFIELLRNASLVQTLGARYLGGLVGDVAIPRQTGGATAYWVAENTAPTESQQTFGQVALTPKTVGAFTDISRKLLMQSSIDVEAFVRTDLAELLAVEIDRVAVNGAGAAGEPTGIINTTGIGSVAGGTNGLAPAWSHIVQLETEVAIDNADRGALAYLSNAKVRGKLKQTLVTPTYGDKMVWGDGDKPGWGKLNGYPAGCSNQVPSNLVKNASGAVCSAIIFGNWAELVIGQWGALDILVDPYTGGAAGTGRVRVLQDVDVACRHAESFAAMLDALTT
jgi:HK97 family phage major capsid protein/HK97 family phage prohead protease